MSQSKRRRLSLRHRVFVRFVGANIVAGLMPVVQQLRSTLA
jgi:hypothetical protein